MAVPVGQRSENKLEVLERAQKYAIHLIEITANTKNFPGRFAQIVTRMCDTAAKAFHLDNEWLVASA